MVTVYDVAQASGLSIASVSRALNGLPGVSSTTAERILRIADDLGYVPNEVARSLVAKSTQTIALLVPDITNPFFPELVKGVQDAADDGDLLLLLLDAPEDPAVLRARLGAVRRKQVDGILLVVSELADDGADADLFGDTPAILLDRGRSGRHASVGIDQEAAGHAATMHLIEHGHRRIGHISGPVGLAVSAQRRAGWERALREAGLAADESLVAEGDFSEESGHRAVERLTPAAGVTAVFAANDLSAIGFLSGCAARGVSVPDDVSVIGLDGIELARYTTPVLTTVAQPIREIGAVACRLLLEQIARTDRVDDVVLPARIQSGATVRARGGDA